MKQGAIWVLAVVLICAGIGFGEFRVNEYKSEDQKDARIAMDREGNFAIVWGSYRQDRSSGGVYCRRYFANGEPMDGEFRVNTVTAGNQKAPDMAMNGDGEIVVVWHGPGDAEDEDIFARRISSAGEFLGDEFVVNNHQENRQLYPRVAMSGDGSFVVVWRHEKLATPPYANVVSCRVFDAQARPVGEQFEISLLLDSRYPHVAMDNAGRFVIVWLEERSSNKVMAQVYDPAGLAKMDPIQVSQVRFTTVTRPAVSADPNGNFIVAWDADPKSALADDIRARRFKFDGTALGDEFIVNTSTDGAQTNSAVSMNDRQECVILWQSEVDPNSNDREVYGQRYDSLGAPLGGEFRVNCRTSDDQRSPGVAIADNGNFVAVWQSFEQDGSLYGIYAERGPAPGSAEFNGDGLVDFHDYCVLAEVWAGNADSPPADLTGDNIIDPRDVAAFTDQWLTPGPECQEADIAPSE